MSLISNALHAARPATSFFESASGLGSDFAARALNPQPLPPKATGGASSLLDEIALNPQPLPPKSASFIASLFDRVALNPQPLPPRSHLADRIWIR